MLDYFVVINGFPVQYHVDSKGDPWWCEVELSLAMAGPRWGEA